MPGTVGGSPWVTGHREAHSAAVVFEGEWMYACVHVGDSANAGACRFPWSCGVFSDGDKGTRCGLKCESWGI